MADGCDEVFYVARHDGRWWQKVCFLPALHAGGHRLITMREMDEIPPADWHRTLIVDPQRVVWRPKASPEGALLPPSQTTALFNWGSYRLASGASSCFKIDCDFLTEHDWESLAALAHERIGPFSAVEGVPRGGLSFARYLAPYAGQSGGLLIVDDVLTTGASMERQRAGRKARGLVVFARQSGPAWIGALFRMRSREPECR